MVDKLNTMDYAVRNLSAVLAVLGLIMAIGYFIAGNWEEGFDKLGWFGANLLAWTYSNLYIKSQEEL